MGRCLWDFGTACYIDDDFRKGTKGFRSTGTQYKVVILALLDGSVGIIEFPARDDGQCDLGAVGGS
jgi:hypothetical protein